VVSDQGVDHKQVVDSTIRFRYASLNMDSTPRTIALSVVMPTVAWSGTFESCARRVLEVMDTTAIDCELVVALDGPAMEPPAWLNRPYVTVVTTGVRRGPAVARNLAAQSARGAVILFVDADVMLTDGTLERAYRRLADDASLAGVFGCYDDMPAHPSVVSRFRNLLHHHTHATSPGPVATFWAGCGAIRRDVLQSVGGFLASYGRPSIEDIELGMRATAAGYRIEIDPKIQGKHLKCWTLKSMVVTDIVHRAVPWSKLLLRGGAIPRTLNIDWRGRASGACATLGALSLAAAPLFPAVLLVTATLAAVAVALNASFFQLCARQGGIGFAFACVPLYLLYLVYSTVTFAAVALTMRPAVGLVAAYLAAAAAVTLVLGVGGSWTQGMDGDLQERALEYRSFRGGLYPHIDLDSPPPGGPYRRSPYLPYAFPMFAALFEPGGLAQARIVVALLSVTALAVAGLYGSRLLSPFGAAWSAVGAFAAAGITINRSTLAQGQFAIICTGLIALQLILLQRGRPVLAGVCWAVAMLKPHVGIAFAALFLFNRQWRGLVAGIAVLAALSALALLWTGVPLLAPLEEWLTRSSMRFTAEPEGFSPGRIAEWLGWNHRVVQYAAIGMIVAALGAVAFATRNVRIQELLIPAALCAVLGRVLIYHRPYDNAMLWPLLLAAIATALRVRSAAAIAVAVAVAFTLWLPLRLQLYVPGAYSVQSAVWMLAGAYLAMRLFRMPRRDGNLL
jgi:hypothetical protein